tara:strand:+ start:1337 stop:2044 length:708 start_codon:yes stop_codon:yes gene_type:complete
MNDEKYITMADLGAVNASKKALVWDGEQGTALWHSARCTAFTGSNAKLIIKADGTPAKSKSLDKYMNKCIADTISQTVDPNTARGSGGSAERGSLLEPKAREWYTEETKNEVRETGFIYTDSSRTSGISPDGICSDRCLEIKCLERSNHIGALRYIKEHKKPPPDYAAQIQMQIWTTGLGLCDLVTYSPSFSIPCKVFTVEADPVAQKSLDELIPKFVADVKRIAEEIKRDGGAL